MVGIVREGVIVQLLSVENVFFRTLSCFERKRDSSELLSRPEARETTHDEITEDGDDKDSRTAEKPNEHAGDEIRQVRSVESV